MADVTEIPESELIRRAIASLGLKRNRPRWALVMDLFVLGSTYSAQLCRIHGFDPDETKGSSRERN